MMTEFGRGPSWGDFYEAMGKFKEKCDEITRLVKELRETVDKQNERLMLLETILPPEPKPAQKPRTRANAAAKA